MITDEMIERVERGEGADRELDGDLCIELRAHPYGPDHWLKDPDFSFHQHPCEGWVQPMDRDGVTPLPGGGWAAPAYTTSLDTVVSLIEAKLPGWCCAAIRRPDTSIGYVHNNELAFIGIADKPNPARRWFECRADSPARALLAATLRALRALTGEPT